MGIARLLEFALVLESSVKALLSAAKQVATKKEKGKMFIEEWMDYRCSEINPGKFVNRDMMDGR